MVEFSTKRAFGKSLGGTCSGIGFPTGTSFRLAKRQKGRWSLFNSLSFRKRAKLKIFGCIRNIMEVVIAPIRNKIGKRFGFARFLKVEDACLLVVKLDNVFIERKKIHTNVPRFKRKVFSVADTKT